MSTIDTLLDKAINNGDIVLTIDEPTREIRYTGELLLGVEGDCQAEKIYFEAPKTVGNFIDLQAESTLIYVDFKTAEGEPYFIECGDREYHEDTDTVSFSWLLTERVAVKKGTVKFRVCVKTDEDEPKEWHTSIFTGKILEGINVEGKSPEIVPDETITTYKLMEEVKALQARLADIEAYADSVVNTAIASYNYIPREDATELFVNQDEYNEYTMNTQKTIDEIFEVSIPNLNNQTGYTHYASVTLTAPDAVIDLSTYFDKENDHGHVNELMIIIRTKGETHFGIINPDSANAAVEKDVSSGINYTKVSLNIIRDKNMHIWDLAGNVFPTSVEEAYTYTHLLINRFGTSDEYPSYSIYGR